ncbi:YbaB/EbfC family nucleoid-associated protein [Nocardia sp. NEAU-G5]|uniref:YbaB/EbfC family nucleoid-associated protein n=1 Tax=Nocardia albiluteola TaxID=2842303 RepID=A0ABS6BEX6_9NOCA|nr:YbaB/EbfC family nucleoid-associated protein [Nocardia albiluteola]MBU3067724.1 YbaB/EbfC family nucleoid-associated protein [Nocardia albiluteola]
MTNERAKADLAAVVDGVQTQLQMIAQVQRDRAQLLGTATVLKGRVSVTVNAALVVVETKFGPGAEDMTLSALARAVTDAAQRAAEDLTRKNQELMAPLRSHRARMPSLADLIEGMPDLRAGLGEPPKPSLARPNSPDREPPPEGGGLRFTDVEDIDRSAEPSGRVTDSSW